MTPQISAIIRFNSAALYLADAVASVSRQTFTDWELLLVDGDPSDGSEDMASELQADSPDKVRVLRHDDGRALDTFSSRLRGAREARAPLLAHLDSDDEWHPQFLERHYAVYREVFADRPGAVFCPVVYWWEEPSLANQSYVQPAPAPGLHLPPDLTLEFLEDGYAKSPTNSGVMTHREVIVEASYLAGTATENCTITVDGERRQVPGEDQYLWSDVALKYPIYVSPEPLARYRQWSGSVCARASATGEIEASRLRHLDWLQEHLTASYGGPRKRQMSQTVRSLSA
jgi:glycosyltransferase involved in cell wall biosynthesis